MAGDADAIHAVFQGAMAILESDSDDIAELMSLFYRGPHVCAQAPNRRTMLPVERTDLSEGQRAPAKAA